jgi:hypothetical protein
MEAARRAFYERDMSADDSIAIGLQALYTYYGDFECPPEEAKSLERTAGAFEYYWEQYALSHLDAYPIILAGNKRAIEYSFAHPLPLENPVTGQPIIYAGRFDAIINYGGSIFICDEKTTGQLGKTWPKKWDLRAQFLGYIWACREAGIHVDGALVRGIAIYKTMYNTAQAPVTPHDELVAGWYTELLMWVERMIDDWKRNRWFHAYDDACNDYGGCMFKDICTWHEPQKLPELFERRIWNPILRIEEMVTSDEPPMAGIEW